MFQGRETKTVRPDPGPRGEHRSMGEEVEAADLVEFAGALRDSGFEALVADAAE